MDTFSRTTQIYKEKDRERTNKEKESRVLQQVLKCVLGKEKEYFKNYRKNNTVFFFFFLVEQNSIIY